jgi:hypothetical protein
VTDNFFSAGTGGEAAIADRNAGLKIGSGSAPDCGVWGGSTNKQIAPVYTGALLAKIIIT